MTGTNFELEHTEDFLPIATYRLMNHQTVRNILDGSQNLNFSPGILESYRQSIGTAPHFHEKLTKPNNRFNTSIKSLIDRIRTASSVEDFYIRLFQTQ